MDKRQFVLVALFAASLFAVQSFFKPSPTPQPTAEVSSPPTKGLEERYVLETPLQQVVFSNLGGSVAEINLTLKSPAASDSIVKVTEIDKQLLQASPENARFPLYSYNRINPATGQLEKVQEGVLGGYYPLLRRGLVSFGGHQDQPMYPEYYALSLSTVEGPVTQPFQLKMISSNKIVFEWKENDRRITRTYELGQPPLASTYLLKTQIDTEGAVGSLWISSGVPEVELVGGSHDPLLQYALQQGGAIEVEKADLPKTQASISSLYPQWLSSSNGFFSLILDPQSEVGPGFRTQYLASKAAPSRTQLLPGHDAEPPGYRFLLPLGSRPGSTQFMFYAGPLEETALRLADQAVVDSSSSHENPHFEAAQTYYGFFTFISTPFARFMWWLMKGFYALCNNWSLSILFLSIALQVITFPLSQWSAKVIAKTKALEPELQELRKKFEKQPQLFRVAQAELYKARGVNTLSAVFPNLIKIPLLLGMLDLLRTSFALRGATCIPGWIPDLAAPDVLFSWGFHIPLLGSSFHLLPVILGLLMYAQGRIGAMGSSNAPAEPLSDEQRSRALISKIFPIGLTLLFYNAPSGLNLYWLFTTILSIVHQEWVNRRAGKEFSSSKVIPLNRR